MRTQRVEKTNMLLSLAISNGLYRLSWQFWYGLVSKWPLNSDLLKIPWKSVYFIYGSIFLYNNVLYDTSSMVPQLCCITRRLFFRKWDNLIQFPCPLERDTILKQLWYIFLYIFQVEKVIRQKNRREKSWKLIQCCNSISYSPV